MLDQGLAAHAVPRLVQSVATIADDPDSKTSKESGSSVFESVSETRSYGQNY
jgi:hypothetical protein